jgi:hypothetical protein
MAATATAASVLDVIDLPLNLFEADARVRAVRSAAGILWRLIGRGKGFRQFGGDRAWQFRELLG